MALDVTFLNNVTREKFIKVLKNNLYDETPLLKRMLEKGRVQTMTGRSLLWDVVMKRHSAFGYFSGYDVLASQPINPTVQAALNTANYYATLAISMEEEMKNTGNMEKLLDMLKIQFDNAEATLKEQIAKDIYGNTTTTPQGKNTINGLGLVIATANTYANIDRTVAANAPWQSNLNSTAYAVNVLEDPTQTGYLPSLMRTQITNASHGGQPDMIFTTKTLYNIYLFIAEANHLRFVNNETANLSFNSAMIDNIPIYYDDYCNAKGMYFLNSKDWSVFVFPKANFDAVEANGSIWRIPTDQLAKVAHIIWMGQLRCDSPWRQAALTALG